MAAVARARDTRQALKDRLLHCAVWGQSNYRADGPLPAYSGTAWAATTAFSAGAIVYSGGDIFLAQVGGTSASTAPSGTGPAIADGTVVWAYAGPRVAVAWAQGLTIAAGQTCYNGGSVFKAATAGTTAASGTGPTIGSLSDNTVTWVYLSPQRHPLVTYSTSSSLTQQVGFNSSTLTVLGGTMVQVGANSRGKVLSATTIGSGNPDIGGSGYVAAVTDEPIFNINIFNGGYTGVWIDGEFVAFLSLASGVQNYVTLDFSGVAPSRKARAVKVGLAASCEFVGFRSAGTGVFLPYSPYDPIKAVLIGDSFPEGGTHFLSYAAHVGRRLGIENFRVSGVGGTGVQQINGSRVNYVDRFTVDVINQAPDLVIIQPSQNDISFSTAAVKAANKALVRRVQVELPNAFCIQMGIWNARSPLSGTTATINTDARALASECGIPFVDWSDINTGTGQINSRNGVGNSDFNTTTDGTHPTVIPGHNVRGSVVGPRIVAAYNALV